MAQSLTYVGLPFTNITVLFPNAVDFVIPKKGESLLEAYETWRKWADEKGTCTCMFFKNNSFLYIVTFVAFIKIKSTHEYGTCTF